MPLKTGSRLGAYDIVGPIGAGGMGEVYKARDSKLDRDVAIKVLPELFSADPDRLARFEREAKTLAALNHPNIAQVFGFENSDGVHALVMELVDGQDLSQIIASGPAGPHMDVTDVLKIAKQIADALEAAHEQGIVHRDLKPANVKVRDDGHVKVLDFGLAKAMDPAGASGSAAMNSPTLTARFTQMGMIIGTAAYMAPEQARGKAVDRRADIWAFGVVVYEMLTGRRVFEGEEISDVLAAVLRQDIDWTAIPAGTPPRLTRLIERCLDRDPKSRLRDIGEARIEIGKIESGAVDLSVTMPAVAMPVTAAPARLRWLPWAVAAILAAGLLITLALWSPWTPVPAAQPVRFAISPSAALVPQPSTTDRVLAISPDGTRLAYVAADGSLVVRAIDQLDAVPIRGLTNARAPFFSPDGQWLGFFETSGAMKKVAVTGGPAISIGKLSAALPRGASWGPDDTIIFATAELNTGLMSIPAGGGEPMVLTKADAPQGEIDHQMPFVLPGGRAVVFTIVPASLQVESMQVAVLDLATGKRKTLIRGGSDAQYVEPAPGGPGFIVYAAAGTLRAVRFNLKTLDVIGDAVPVVDGVAVVSTGIAEYSISKNGALVYLPGTFNGAGAPRSLVWVDRKGHETPISKAPPRAYFAVRISPDGTRLALDIRDQDSDIWVWHIVNQTLTRLTFQPGVDGLPVWTPDNRRIVFYNSSNSNNLMWQAADGTGAPEPLTTTGLSQAPSSFSPDATRLLFRVRPGVGGDDVNLLTMDKKQITPLIQTSFNENNAQVSPDGHWLAYDSNEATPAQIYARPFPDVNSGRWQVSTSGGVKPAWSRSGRELFYATDTAIMAVPVKMSPSFSFGEAVKLFDARPVSGLSSGRYYDVMPGDQKFILIKDPPPDPATGGTSQSIVVVVNWIRELTSKLPIK